MKRFYPFALLLISLHATAQNAPDFTIDDVEGNTRHLYSELNNGHVVVLKFFTNWCTICNATAEDVNTIYDSYVSNSEPVVFWAIDRDPNETNADAITFRDNNSIPYPVIGEGSTVANLFGVQYQPEYYIISPDRSFVERTNYTQLEAAIDNALMTLSIGAGSDDENSVSVEGEDLSWSVASGSDATLLISDMSGRTVLSEQISGSGTLRLNNLNSGIYLYTLIQDGNTAISGKFATVN